MNRSSHQFFSSAGFSEDEHSGRARRNCLYLLQNAGQGWAGADDLLQIKLPLNVLLNRDRMFTCFPFQIGYIVNWPSRVVDTIQWRCNGGEHLV